MHELENSLSLSLSDKTKVANGTLPHSQKRLSSALLEACHKVQALCPEKISVLRGRGGENVSQLGTVQTQVKLHIFLLSYVKTQAKVYFRVLRFKRQTRNSSFELCYEAVRFLLVILSHWPFNFFRSLHSHHSFHLSHNKYMMPRSCPV